jgi:PPP family 3-phenylpropionic acid transporter
LVLCLAATAVRWALVAGYPDQLAVQFLAQAVHALSFALFQSLAMRLMFLEFSADQQGRAQALYSMLWGLGVACGSLLAGLVWDRVGGSMIFAAAALICVMTALLCMGFWPHNTVSPVQKDA